MTTVSAYLSWNSGVAYRNSRPGCDSNNYFIIGLKSSVKIYSLPGLAINLKILFLTSYFSNSPFQYALNSGLFIFPVFAESILSYNMFLKNFGNPHTSTVIYSKSSFLSSGFSLKILSMSSSCFLSSSESNGFPSGK